MQSIIAAMGDSLCEGVRILDWGCGAGRLANWISREIQDFDYLGVDIRNEFGTTSIEAAISWLGHDPRVAFLFVDEFNFDYSVGYDIAVLGSVLTHIMPAHGLSLLSDLVAIVPKVIFTCFGPDSVRKASARICDGMIKRVVVDEQFFESCRGLGMFRELEGFDAHKKTRSAIRHRWFELCRK